MITHKIIIIKDASDNKDDSDWDNIENEINNTIKRTVINDFSITMTKHGSLPICVYITSINNDVSVSDKIIEIIQEHDFIALSETIIIDG